MVAVAVAVVVVVVDHGVVVHVLALGAWGAFGASGTFVTFGPNAATNNFGNF